MPAAIQLLFCAAALMDLVRFWRKEIVWVVRSLGKRPRRARLLGVFLSHKIDVHIRVVAPLSKPTSPHPSALSSPRSHRLLALRARPPPRRRPRPLSSFSATGVSWTEILRFVEYGALCELVDDHILNRSKDEPKKHSRLGSLSNLSVIFRGGAPALFLAQNSANYPNKYSIHPPTLFPPSRYAATAVVVQLPRPAPSRTAAIDALADCTAAWVILSILLPIQLCASCRLFKRSCGVLSGGACSVGPSSSRATICVVKLLASKMWIWALRRLRPLVMSLLRTCIR
ncbi:hypothetical protein C8R45DRAFT_1014787 [Mycena sanguinolenta]|nr:hypothetical protein C8R45DRAFT_1014787 [Mycena sanguinolenta]